MAWTSLSDRDWDNVPGFDPMSEKYVRLDLDRWLKKHAVLETAREQGAKNQPPSDASGLDGTESRIVAWINRRGRKTREDVSGHLSDFERELAHTENDQELIVQEQKVDQVEKNAENELEGKVNEGRNDLSQLEKEIEDARRDFKEFREQSGLTRLPDYSHRKSALTFIIVCYLVEAVLNATLLMDVNPFGLLGSTMQMLLISAVNIWILGLLMGGLLRRKNHVRISTKVLSWLGILGSIVAAVGFNLFVGHFRDSVQEVLNNRSANVLQMGSDALQRLTDDPAGLDSFQTVLLVLLGISCFGLASWKWLQRDDPYPDYGSRGRELKKKEEEYPKKYDEVQSELKKTYKRFEERLEDIRHQLQIKQSQWRETCGRGRRLVTEYSVNVGQYQDDLNFLLNAYRDENKSVRTNPAPAQFSKQVSVGEDILKPPSFTPPPETNIQGVMGRVHDAIRRLQDQYLKSCRRFPPLEEI